MTNALTKQLNPEFHSTMLSFVGKQLSGYYARTHLNQRHMSMTEVLNETVLHQDRLDEAKAFFAQHGWDTEEVNRVSLIASAVSLGLVATKPSTTFSEKLDCIKQYQQGLVTEAELISSLQCTDTQLQCLSRHRSLPAGVYEKVSLADWDNYVEVEHARLAPPKTRSVSCTKLNVQDISWIKPGIEALWTVPNGYTVRITSVELELISGNLKIRATPREGDFHGNFSVEASDLEPLEAK